MPVSAIRTIAKSQNGVGAFVLQCKRLEFHYCNWWGSSRGMNAFIKSSLASFAKRNPSIEISVSPAPRRHPVIKAYYVNGAEKSICVRNLTNEGVREKAEFLRDTSGEKNIRVTKPVTSINENVRGIWSPFHGAKIKI